MANTCDTSYKVVGSPKAVKDLWNSLLEMEVNSKDIYLCDLAERYGIDYEKKGFSVRGHIYWAEFEEDEANDYCLLSFDVESAWCACDQFFNELNRVLGGMLSISYREIEPGCDIYYVHDAADFFPEECCVRASGEPFDDEYNEIYTTVADAIDKWCEKTGISQDGRNEDEMLDFINGYEYAQDDTYFYINKFTFV